MKTFYAPLSELAGIEQLKKDFEVTGQPVMISGCIDTQKIHLVHAAVNDYRFRLIITGDEAKAREMQEDSRFFDKSSIYYPAKDFIFYSADVHGNQLAGERLRCIQKIIAAQDNKTNITVITTIDGCVDMLMPLQRYRDNIIHFKNSDIIDTEKLISKLVGIGYTRVPMIDGQGQFAVRGGIIDIFSYTDETPVRIELWDDEIDSIRFFDVESQRSVEKIQTYDVFPATEWILSEDEIDAGFEKVKDEVEKQLVTLGNDKKKKTQQEMDACNRLRHAYADFERTRDYSKFILSFTDEIEGFTDYFPKDETVFVLDEPDRIMERMELISYEYEESMKNRLEGGYVVASQTKLMRPIAEVYKNIQSSRLMLLSSLDYKPKMLKPADYLRIDARSISSYNNSFEYLADDINKYKRTGYRVVLVCNSRTRAARIVADLEELGTQSYFSEDYDKEIMPGTVMVTYGNIHRGFEYPLIGFVIITENDIFTSRTRKKQKKKYEGRSIAGFNELNVGDYVVHEMHGLGVYKGIEKITVEGVEKDYIKIEYAGNSNLYVLATQLDRLQKYAASDTEKKPKLNKLGSVEWNKTKAKVHGAVEEIAKDLVELYSIRQNQKGYAFGPDTVWQKEFEEMFPYEETDDQLNAIADTKADMESTRIMDRLICGDVGYGKTEVAIRAAFKAVQEGKQVAYLVPTTILAQQHFNTFEQRMKNFPLKVAQLSSFRTNKEIKETLADLKKGFVDVVIGTHRLLSKDVEFKDLGLLIIDEEQRFGVAHKEKIKKLKNNIDVLTLSATPIPRTLHMSIVGVRDMSVIYEPPYNRKPVQTYVLEYDQEVIKEAITRELERNGQVFYLFNNVERIIQKADEISNLVPEAKVVYAHGQMTGHEIENIMEEFIEGKTNVLVCTTILESGIDIPNANTIIVENADRMGLAQLYQIRGRVGRSDRQGYAYITYKRDKLLSEIADKRLKAIKEFTEFGSGFKIAMRDLEIRGAGSLLGEIQSGHLEQVGYDTYCKLLDEVVKEMQGEEVKPEIDVQIDLDATCYIPDEYISDSSQKIEIYQDIALCKNEEDIQNVIDEMIDRFGNMPSEIENLIEIARIKILCKKLNISKVQGKHSFAVFTFELGEFNIDVNELAKNYRNRIKFSQGLKPQITYVLQNATGMKMLKEVEEFLKTIDDFRIKENK